MIQRIREKRRKKEADEILISEFMREHESHIPKFSPRGLKFDWDIYISKEGNYDVYTGEFLGSYEVKISQKPPSRRDVNADRSCYKYDIETKTLMKTGLAWRY